jgi:hypothetical protein
MKNILACIYLLIAASCSTEQSHTAMKDFSVKKTLIAERIPIDQIVAPYFFMLQSKYLCTYSIKDTMIDLFSLPNLSHVKSFGAKGGAPDEFQGIPMPCKSTNDYVYIQGYTPQKIKKLSIDTNLTVEAQEEYVRTTEEVFGYPHIVQDTFLIYHSMGEYSEREPNISIKKMNLKNQEVEKILIPTSEPENISFDPNRGLITVNDTFIVYLYRYKKQIDVYGVDSLNLMKRLKGKSGHPLPEVGDMENIVEHYKFAHAGKSYFYALYNKGGYKLYEKRAEDTQLVQSLEVYDYNGNPIVEYIINDPISFLAIDEANNMMYAYDEDDEEHLLRYKLH